MPEHGKSKLRESAASTPGTRVAEAAATPHDMVAMLRSLPFGGLDDAARNLQVAPQVRSTIAPIVSSLRWSAAMYGMIFGAAEAFTGSYAVVVSLSVCLFLTSWRTILPIRLNSPRRLDRVVSITDSAILALGIGYSGGAASPFVFCLMAAIVVAALGWGYRNGAWAVGIGWVSLLVGQLLFFENPIVVDRPFGLLLGSTVLFALGAAYLRQRLLEAEARRLQLASRVEALSETNDLLTMLNSVARTLPTSLNQRDALDATRAQIIETFRATTICLLEFDETHEEWTPKLTDGCTVRASASIDELPVHLRQALDIGEPWLVEDLTAGSLPALHGSNGSGLYTRLVSRDRTIGVLGIEHPEPGHYRDRDRLLLAGMADVVALSLDNARWFGRLRSLGAEEERVRIARDLHDRLGQWLTYISFELERFITHEGTGFTQLNQLYDDVQTALDELRETLRQLRADITEERPLSVVGAEAVDRFAQRTGVAATFRAPDSGSQLPIPVETELLRILQEALNNIDKHAKAERVDVRYRTSDGTGVLTITDDGRGFDPDRGVRESAYGLVGMRERADAIGARFSLSSTPESGTTIAITVGDRAPTQGE